MSNASVRTQPSQAVRDPRQVARPVTDPPGQAATSTESGGLLDLEKELSCAICTEVLYQPLTVLDCLHTFCGSCLKEWFGWQRVRADQEDRRSHSRRKPYNFTCPSCRAAVREARPNAKVTTLLDMFIQANPARAKSQAEREEISKGYNPGEPVLPVKPGLEAESRHGRRNSSSDDQEQSDDEEEADRRLLEEVRDMSLRQISQNNNPQRQPESRHARRREHQDLLQIPNRPDLSNTHQDGLRRHISQRLGHQSSLRSLMSGSNLTPQEMEEEVMRQIVDEGLLEGIDLENINAEQEDEISERIAQAYRRRRRRHRSQDPPRRIGNNHTSGERSRHHVRTEERARASSASAQAQRRPPVSRPHLFNPVDTSQTSRPRSSSREVSRTSRDRARTPRASIDLGDRPQTLDARGHRSRRMLSQTRSSTDPEDRLSNQWRRGGAGTSDVSGRADTPEVAVNPAPVESSASFTQQHQQQQLQQNSNSNANSPQSAVLSVSCDRCGAPHIEYSVHYTCPHCASSTAPGTTYDLCQRCYRQGRGCQHWFGFGYSAWANWEKQSHHTRPSSNAEMPHILCKQKYSVSSADGKLVPVLEQGVFCDLCGSNANACYWHCEHCNCGEWGYCNACVNTAHHCAHSLRPLALQQSESAIAPSDNPTKSAAAGSSSYVPIGTPTTCNGCGDNIEPLMDRFHCPDCEDGDYDLCLDCYAALAFGHRVDSSIHACLRGHPMLLINFQHDDKGPLRVVLSPPAGGWHASLLSESEHKANEPWSWQDKARHGELAKQKAARLLENLYGHYPHSWFKPAAREDSSSGANVTAQWAYVPAEGSVNELDFPKHAVIEEAVDVNEDWGWGVYCRRGGYFPLAYGAVVP